MRNLRPLLALATILMLPGLLPGCAVERKCGADGCADDAKITANVQLLINQHPEVGPPDAVRVQTLNHVAYLTGRVSEGNMSQTAEAVARASPGVTKVVNNIFVTH